MDHRDHVGLLRAGIPERGGVWADLGSGTGAFTLALADLIGPEGEIYSFDLDARALRDQERALRASFPAVPVQARVADFARLPALPPLDGIVMANALHFQRDKTPALRAVRNALRPGGRFLLVEYNADHGNRFVPYPLSYPTWETVARQHGFEATRLLATVPSRFLQQIYAAISFAPAL